MSSVWHVNILFHTWDRCLFILVDSRLKISHEKKSRQIQAESSDFILNPANTIIYHLSLSAMPLQTTGMKSLPPNLQDFTHLRVIAHKIPNIDMEADILLLIGRDAPPLHKVHESRNGPRDAPWAQRLDLGWVVIRNACLNGAHRPSEIATFKTHFLDNCRPSFMEPCPSLLYVKCETTLDGTPSATNRKRDNLLTNGSRTV